MSNVLHEWQTLGHRYRLCRWGTHLAGWSRLEKSQASWVLRAALADSTARTTVFTALQQASAGRIHASMNQRGLVERELAQGWLVVLEQPIAPIALGRPSAVEPAAPVDDFKPTPARAWIDVIVVEDSVPMRALAGRKFRLRLPDGSTRDGTLDGQGRVHVDDIEPGRGSLEVTDFGVGQGS